MDDVLSKTDMAEIQRKFQHYLMRWKRDPVAYAIEACRTIPTDKQAAFLRNVAKYKFVAIRSGHSIGKSRALALLGHWYLDTHWEPGRKVKLPCTGPSGSNIEDVLWSEMKTVLEMKVQWLKDRWEIHAEKYYCVEGPNDMFARIRTARRENPDALQGFHDALFILDEGSGIPVEVFQVAEGAFADEHSMGAMTGNPTTNAGYFYDVFHEKSFWHTMHVSCLDTLLDNTYEFPWCQPNGEIKREEVQGRVTRRYVEDMLEKYGENSNVYKVRVLGDFGSGTGEVVIPRKSIKDAFEREPFDQSGRERVMGIDVAREGEDDSALVIRQGQTIEYAEIWHGYDTYLTQQKAQNLTRLWAAEGKPIDAIHVDIIGFGAGVYDGLRHSGYPARPVRVSDAAQDSKDGVCHRLRDWLWWRGRTFFASGTTAVKFSRQTEEGRMLFQELSTPTYAIPLDKIKVETKDELKRRGFRSPNIADAFLLTLTNDWHRAAGKHIMGDIMKRKKKKYRRDWKVI